MLASRSKRKILVLAVLVAVAAALIWVPLSVIKIRNSDRAAISYNVSGPSNLEYHGILKPGGSRTITSFVKEGGIHVHSIGANRRECRANIYVVPPLGGKCVVEFTDRLAECDCRLGW